MEHGLLNYHNPYQAPYDSPYINQGDQGLLGYPIASTGNESTLNSMMENYNQQVNQQIQDQMQAQQMAQQVREYEAQQQQQQKEASMAYDKQFVDRNKMVTSMDLPTGTGNDPMADLSRSRNMRMRNLQNYYAGRQ